MIPFSKILWALVNNSIELLIGLGSLILVTRLYPSQEAGAWVLFATLFFFFTKIREGFVQTALVKFSVGLSEAEQHRALKANFVTNLLIEAALSAGVWGVAKLGLYPEVGGLFLFYPLYSLPWALYRWQLFVQQSRLAVQQIFKVNLLILSSLSIGGLGLWLGHWPLEYLVLILGACSFNGAVLGLWLMRFGPVWHAPFAWEAVVQQAQYGKHGILRELSGTLSSRINIFLSAGMLSLVQTALLGVAQRYVQLLLVPNAAIQSLIFPKACELANQGKYLELKQLFEESVAMLLAMFLPVVLVLGLFSWQLIGWINGESYLAAAPLLIVMLITTGLFAPFGNAFGSVMNAVGKPFYNTQVVFVNSWINIGLSVLLVYGMGIYGAVIAPFLSELIGFLYIGRLLNKELGIHFSRAFQLIPRQYAQWWGMAQRKLHTAFGSGS